MKRLKYDDGELLMLRDIRDGIKKLLTRICALENYLNITFIRESTATTLAHYKRAGVAREKKK